MQTHDQLMGKFATDRITGFKGTVTGYLYHLTGCNQVILTPKVDGDGKKRDGEWFDVQRLDVQEDVPAITLDNSKTPGGATPPPLPAGR